MNDTIVRVPGRIVFGRLRFEDDRKPEAFADLLFVDPSAPYRLGALGMGLQLAGSPPWTLARGLPGEPFGSAVARTLPPRVIQSILAGEGGLYTEVEVADFLRPVLDAAARGQVILGGVPSPPSADPVYAAFTLNMFPYWQFIAGDDRAEPLVPQAVPHLALRVFTPMEFGFVQRCGGRLRPMPEALAEVLPNGAKQRSGFAGRPTSMDLALGRMKERAALGQLAPTIAGETRYLSDWLRQHHPDEPQALPKTIGNSLAAEYRRLKLRP